MQREMDDSTSLTRIYSMTKARGYTWSQLHQGEQQPVTHTMAWTTHVEECLDQGELAPVRWIVCLLEWHVASPRVLWQQCPPPVYESIPLDFASGDHLDPWLQDYPWLADVLAPTPRLPSEASSLSEDPCATDQLFPSVESYVAEFLDVSS